MAFWGLLLLDVNKPELLGVFIGLTYTFYSSFFIRSFVKNENRKLLFIKFIGPVLYLLVGFYAQPINLYSVIAPINIAFLIFCISLFSKDALPKKEVQFFVIAFMYLYSFSLYNLWDKNINQKSKLNQYDFERKAQSITYDIPKLSQYKFLDSNFDTISLSNNNDYVIIETWNEKCPPCFKAIAGMADFYKNIETKAKHYNVYVQSRKNIDFSKVFTFDRIKNKKSILVDLNLQSDAALSQYPVFLVFNKHGNLIFSQIGYTDDTKKQLQDGILSAIK